MSSGKMELEVRTLGARRGVEYVVRRGAPSSGGDAGVVGYFALVVAAAGAAALWQWRQQRAISAPVAFALAIIAVVGLLKAVLAGRTVVEEALLVVPSLGVQLRTTRRNGATSTKFVDRRRICAAVIHESITFSSVIYVLGFMVDGQDDMLLAFEELRPRISVLQEVYRGTKRLLFPNDAQPMRFPDHLQRASAVLHTLQL